MVAVGHASAKSEWFGPCILVRILLPFVHLLLKSLCFLFIGKTQGGKAVFHFEGVEEGTVLVVDEGVKYLLVPDDASIGWLYAC